MVKVACCWDDGVTTDIRLIEILRKYNAKATFNLCPGLAPQDTVASQWVSCTEPGRGFRPGKVGLKDYPAVYGDFQVASHCWTHKNAGVVPDEEFMKDALDARKYLEDVFQRECTGFAWPCGRHTPVTEKLMAEAGFSYGRTTTYSDHVAPGDNPMALDSSCHFLAGDFHSRYLKAREENGIFYFWGHSYEIMDYDKLWAYVEEKFKVFADDPEVEWVDVIDIVKK